MVYHMVGIGEETGGLDTMLDKVAEYYEEEVTSATEQHAAAGTAGHYLYGCNCNPQLLRPYLLRCLRCTAVWIICRLA